MAVIKRRMTTITSPVYWGSILGILVGSIISALNYLDLLGERVKDDSNPGVVFVAVFICLACLRYYFAIVFVAYKDSLTTEVAKLSISNRKRIFRAQVFLVCSCTVNLSLLPSFGAGAACFVILLQSLATLSYWKALRTIAKAPKEQLVLIGDVAILGVAAFYFLWEAGYLPREDISGGMLLAVTVMVVIYETFTIHVSAIRAYVSETASSLS